MLALKQTLSTLIFTFICFAAILVPQFISWEERQGVDESERSGSLTGLENQSYFYRFRYYVSDNKPVFHLDAEELTMNNLTGENFFLAPAGTMFDEQNNTFRYRAQRGKLLKNKNELTLSGNVWIYHLDSQVNAHSVFYEIDKDRVTATGDVFTKNINESNNEEIEIRAPMLVSWPSLKRAKYTGGVVGRIKRNRAYEENIDFSSEILFSDLVAQKLDLDQDVYLKKQSLTARSKKGEVFLENYNKKLKYFVLYDDVKVREKVVLDRNDTFERKAFGEKLEGHQNEGLLVLTGYPKVYQREDVIKGNKIQLRENNEVIEVEDSYTNIKIR